MRFDTWGLDAPIDYRPAWAAQRELHAGVVAGDEDVCALVQHTPVFTAGKRTNYLDRPAFDVGAEVIDVDRGGRITWHGPGQLVGYPILRLPEPVDVVEYVRRLEGAIIAVCAEFGVPTGRVEGRTGVWVTGHGRDRKICAIGVRVAQGVTMHGFALNCDADLNWFSRIVPCGIPDADVTSLTRELGRDVTIAEVLPIARRQLAALGDRYATERIERGAAARAAEPAMANRAEATAGGPR